MQIKLHGPMGQLEPNDELKRDEQFPTMTGVT